MPRLRKAKHSRPRPYRGWVLPGYNYLGPGNDLDNGEPTNESDAAAQRHDVEYDKYQKEGQDPYWNWNKADETFLSETEAAKDYGGRLGHLFFSGKKRAHSLGFIGRLPDLDKRRRLQSNARTSVQTPSLLNSPASTNMDGEGSGNQQGLKETPIDEIQWVERGPPDYTYASLPFRLNTFWNNNNSNEINLPFRMTSVYDCKVDITATDKNTGAGTTTVYEPTSDAADATFNEARWFNFYASLYKYYHVVACRYRLTVENLSNDALWVHRMYYNDTMQPSGASNQDIMLWPNVKSHYVEGIAYGINASGFPNVYDIPSGDNDEDVGMVTTAEYANSNHVRRNGKNIVQITGEYRPGDYRREIRLDADVENWTLCTTNPSLPERVNFRFKHDNDTYYTNSANSANRPFNFRWKIEIDYLVEFKELKDGLLYPVQRQPLTVTIAQDPTIVDT